MNFPKKNETERLIGKQYPSPINQKKLKGRKEKRRRRKKKKRGEEDPHSLCKKKPLRNKPRTK